ncbi:Alkaline ceramidase 3 [Holothuria leucospilota]|uniref:Alkaline ceramidase n=1 Tax=Holothuria leucospilota TaxID=206669 RepID=A0A9Q1BQA9_HOLLE|nr:Alkaline ceramidase 3 [Holothuria leucospilota]
MPPAERFQDDFWGTPTATLEWCEENYDVTFFIAEFYNTVSNLAFIVPSVLGIIFASEDKLEKRYIFSFLATLMIGISSTAFHLTLKLEMQMWDELSMLWGVSFFVYSMFECYSSPKSTNYTLALCLFIYSLTISTAYIMLQEPVFHQVAFSLLTFAIILRAILCSSGSAESKFLIWYSIALYLSAFILWLIDNNFCDSLRFLREKLPFPLSSLFQFHAWWHILIAIANQGQIYYSCMLRRDHLKQSYKLQRWLSVIPYLRVVKEHV